MKDEPIPRKPDTRVRTYTVAKAFITEMFGGVETEYKGHRTVLMYNGVPWQQHLFVAVKDAKGLGKAFVKGEPEPVAVVEDALEFKKPETKVDEPFDTSYGSEAYDQYPR